MTAEVEEYFDGVERLFLLSPVVLSFSVTVRDEGCKRGLSVLELSFPTAISSKFLSLWLPNLMRF
jgi:hypothetical protein